MSEIEPLSPPQSLANTMAERQILGENLALQIIADHHLQPTADGLGLTDGNFVTKSVSDPDGAQLAKDYLKEHGGDVTPTHMFVMSQKGASGHLIMDSDGHVRGISVSYLTTENNQLVVKPFYEAGETEAVTMARAASQVDAYNRGLDVSWATSSLSLESLLPAAPSIEQAQDYLSSQFQPEDLGLKATEHPSVFEGRLKDGRTVVIRPAEPTDYPAITDIQIQAWELPEGDPKGLAATQENDLAKVNQIDQSMLVAAIQNPDGSSEVVSFVFGFPGFKHGEFTLFSHMAATLPEYQSQGVMQIIKNAQIVMVARQGISAIRWTYDFAYASIASNHMVNFVKLVGQADTFYPDPYGRDVTDIPKYAANGGEPNPPGHRVEIVLSLSSSDFQDQIKNGTKKPFPIEEARTLPRASKDSQANLLAYPIRDANKSKFQYVMDFATNIDPLLRAGYKITNISTSFDRTTGQVDDAYFILEKAA